MALKITKESGKAHSLHHLRMGGMSCWCSREFNQVKIFIWGWRFNSVRINKNTIFCLMGPTASGKTKLAADLVRHFPFEIISVDSAMVYRGMNIGTAKPTVEELKIAPHHLIDICDPHDTYSAGQFRQDAIKKIEEIFARGNIPLLVGGTMLYFRVLQFGISNLPRSDEQVRTIIREQRDKIGLEGLYLRLQQIDPQTAVSIAKTDGQRIQRALEVYELTGKTLSELQRIFPPEVLPYTTVSIAISPADILDLRKKIKTRFAEMLRLGFIEEVEALYRREDLHIDLPSVRTVGYRQIWQYLAGQLSYEQMLELVPIITGRLAKRQLTWLRSWPMIHWFDSDSSRLLYNVMGLLDS